MCVYHSERLYLTKPAGITVRELIAELKKLPQDLPVAGGSGDEYLNAVKHPDAICQFKNVVAIQFSGNLYTIPRKPDTVCKTEE